MFVVDYVVLKSSRYFGYKRLLKSPKTPRKIS